MASPLSTRKMKRIQFVGQLMPGFIKHELSAVDSVLLLISVRTTTAEDQAREYYMTSLWIQHEYIIRRTTGNEREG